MSKVESLSTRDSIPKIRTLSSYRRRTVDINVTPADGSEISDLHSYISDVLGDGIASVDTVRDVHAKQGFSIWKVEDGNGKTSGVFALLYLNAEGLKALKEDRFDARAPDMDHLAEQPQSVVAIFAWCFVLRGKAKAALLKVATWLDLCGWNECPIFTNPVTPQGSRLAEALGFRPVHDPNQSALHAVM